MPKVSTETTEAVKRAPRKRAVRRVVTKSDTPVKRVRTAAPRTRVEASDAPVRKAPARVVEVAEVKSRKKLYTVLSAVVLVAGAATWIGVSDAGAIDVTARINEVNERAASAPRADESEDTTQSIVVPVQNTPPVVEVSNLRRRGVGTADVAQPTTEPAVVTEETATTSEEVVEGEVTQEGSEETPPESSTEEVSTEPSAE